MIHKRLKILTIKALNYKLSHTVKFTVVELCKKVNIKHNLHT